MKDDGAWSIPKGEYTAEENPLAAAMREFEEETGGSVDLPPDAYIALTSAKQPSGKVISAWAVESDYDPSTLRSNTFSTEWPPRSGRFQDFPEVDRAEWFSIETAYQKIQQGQRSFLDELARRLLPSLSHQP